MPSETPHPAPVATGCRFGICPYQVATIAAALLVLFTVAL